MKVIIELHEHNDGSNEVEGIVRDIDAGKVIHRTANYGWGYEPAAIAEAEQWADEHGHTIIDPA